MTTTNAVAPPVGNTTTGKANQPINPATNKAAPVKGSPAIGTVATDGKAVTAPDPLRDVKHKVKVDNNETEIDYDELVAGYQLKKASLNRMNEATKTDQLARDVMKRFNAKDLKAFEQVGVDPVEWAESILQSKIENDLLTPEQKEKKELLAKLKGYEDEKKTVEQAKQEAEFQKAYNHHMDDFDQKFTEALKVSKLPKTERTISRMAYHMLEANKAGVDLSPMDVVSIVKDEYQTEHQELWGESDLDQLYQQFGQEKINKLIKMHNAKMSKGDPTPSRQRTNGVKPVVKAGNAGKAANAPKSTENTYKSIRDRYS